jgi:hypothetical protein
MHFRMNCVFLLSVLIGCGSATKEADVSRTPSLSSNDSPAAPGSAAAQTSAAAQPSAATQNPSAPEARTAEPGTSDDETVVPTSCPEPGRKPCIMKPAFVKRLCSKANPDIAVALFGKDTPWLRVYVNVRQADSYNGLGGPSSQEKLTFDEELLVLFERKPDMGGMKVSGAGASYDLLRWDGTCATLTVQEVTERKPPKAKHANIPWRSLSDSVQQALLKDEKAASFATARRKECKGVDIGAVSLACEKAVRGLNDRVADAVRSGLAVPLPTRLP